MKTTLLPDALRLDWIGPLARLRSPSAGALRPMLVRQGIDGVRVTAVLEALRAGHYVADADEVAAGVLAAIAPGRRH